MCPLFGKKPTKLYKSYEKYLQLRREPGGYVLSSLAFVDCRLAEFAVRIKHRYRTDRNGCWRAGSEPKECVDNSFMSSDYHDH